jgi:phage terminase large subunit GpA-like protein
VDYGFLPDFDAVRALAFETTYPRAEGGEICIHRAGLDTGGGKAEEGAASKTEQAYKFILGCPPGRIYAVKGASNPFEKRVLPKVIGKLPSSKSPIAGGLVLYFLDTGYFKELVHASMREDSPHPAYLHAETTEDFADQLTAERQVLRKGKLLWERIRRDNHYLDCSMIAWACAGVEWAPSLLGLYMHRKHQDEAARKAEEAQMRQQGQVGVAANPFARGRNPFRKGGR